jgi:hypothetical protein
MIMKCLSGLRERGVVNQANGDDKVPLRGHAPAIATSFIATFSSEGQA